MPPLRHPHPDRRGQGENQTLHEDRHRVLPQTATLTAPSPQTILDVLPACASPGRASWHLPVPKTALRSSQQFHPQILRTNRERKPEYWVRLRSNASFLVELSRLATFQYPAGQSSS